MRIGKILEFKNELPVRYYFKNSRDDVFNKMESRVCSQVWNLNANDNMLSH